MAETSAWMPLYIGDYLADTMHLTGAQHGAYLMLIMHYWRSGPLPADERALATIARTERKEWAADVGPAVREFFKLGDDGRLHHKRIDQELASAGAHVAQRRAAGKASAEARKRQREVNEKSTSVATEQPTEGARNGRPSPSPIRKEEREESNTHKTVTNPRASGVCDDPEFQEFWDLYPKKDDKGHARRAFVSASRKASAATIVTGLRRYRFSQDPKYIPLAATWLNGERWLAQVVSLPLEGAEPSAANPAGRQPTRMSGGF